MRFGTRFCLKPHGKRNYNSTDDNCYLKNGFLTSLCKVNLQRKSQIKTGTKLEACFKVRFFLRLLTSAENTLLDLHNYWDHAQQHKIIDKLTGILHLFFFFTGHGVWLVYVWTFAKLIVTVALGIFILSSQMFFNRNRN